MLLQPPLCFTRADAERMVDAMRAVLDHELTPELKASLLTQGEAMVFAVLAHRQSLTH